MCLHKPEVSCLSLSFVNLQSERSSLSSNRRALQVKREVRELVGKVRWIYRADAVDNVRDARATQRFAAARHRVAAHIQARSNPRALFVKVGKLFAAGLKLGAPIIVGLDTAQ